MTDTTDKPVPRRGIVGVVPVLYIAGAAAYTEDARPLAWIGIAAGLVVSLLAWRRAQVTAPRIALAVVVATSALSIRTAWGACLREAAALIVGLAAANALESIESDIGLSMRATDAVRGLHAKTVARAAAGVVILAWGSALIVEIAAWFGSEPMRVAAPVIATVAGTLAVAALGSAALLVASLRRLELAAPPRGLAATAACGVALLSALGLAITGTLHPEGAIAFAAGVAGTVMVRVLKSPDAWKLARRGRRALTLLLFGGPVVVLAAVASEGHVSGSGLVAMGIALVAMLVGAFANRLEEPFLPIKGRLLNALAEATTAAHDRDAREAVARALHRVREGAGDKAESPELWMLHPTRICTIDAAGYLTEKEVELPPALLDIAAGEPDHTLRVEVLKALEVRRADLRPLLHWMQERGALFATLVAGSEEPDGVLIVPIGLRVEPVTLEEVRAARQLADAFVAVCQARSAQQRSMIRERDLQGRVDALDDELAIVRHASGLDGQRNELASSRLARPATIGIYSAASRLAYDAIERRVERGAPLVLAARAGIDPVPFVARAHLAGPRRTAPLVIVDGTSTREHDLERWKERTQSPLALADRGLLVLVDGAALPRDVQVLVARSLSERLPPWERAAPLDIAIAFAGTQTPERLVEDGRLSPELFARFEDAVPIELPGLHERAEDLFSIVADRLAREGLKVRGRPIGIDASAFSRLVEHPFDGEDAELASIVTRLVAEATGDVVRAADIDRLHEFVVRTSRSSHTGS